MKTVGVAAVRQRRASFADRSWILLAAGADARLEFGGADLQAGPLVCHRLRGVGRFQSWATTLAAGAANENASTDSMTNLLLMVMAGLPIMAMFRVRRYPEHCLGTTAGCARDVPQKIVVVPAQAENKKRGA